MAKKYKNKRRRNRRGTPVFLVILLNFIIIALLISYIIYLRFVPYTTLEYDGYAVTGKDIVTNLLSTTFDADYSVKALKVSDQDNIYENLSSYYLGASKQDNINLNYPIYVNDALALYNLSSNVTLITDDFQEIAGYSGMTLSSGALYNASTLQRADYYDYILLKNSDNLYISTKDIKIKTSLNEYTIPMNSIINFTSTFITYYTLSGDEFVYNKILDIDESSIVTIEDYNRQYSYREFLLGLKIIKETTSVAEEEEENQEENTTKTNNTVANTVLETPKNQTEEQTTEIEEENIEEETTTSSSGTAEIVWVKPTVTCDNFVANVYSASATISITDPSRVIYKAVTFTFYKDGEIAFRTSATSSGTVSITKLLPDTTYTIIGTYQYRNKEGSLLENTILEQEITTKSVDTLNAINLSLENGQIYSNKIEIANIHITSDISDEAIYGVSKAEILINGTKYSVSSATLRSILKGESITYQSSTGLESNTKYEYEIVFYDTAGNVMNVTNNTGSTVTSKKAPSVTVKVSAQEVISVTITPTMVNDDNVSLSNYRYILYSSTGEEISSGTMSDDQLEFGNLDPEYTYTIKMYADFDIEDGKGMQYNQEIGSATFTTLPLSKLGSLKLNVSYDQDTDITCNSINLNMSINTTKTDSRLISILNTVTLSIQDTEGQEIESVVMTDISSLSTEEGIDNLIENLNSNTTYNIVITATALQGNTEEEISTSYTLTKFITNKMPATISITNVIVTTNLIDMDVYIDDIDGSCTEGIVTIRLTDVYGKEYLPNIEPTDITSNAKIPTNETVRLTYTGLTEGETYTLVATVASYNETNDSTRIQNNVQIGTAEFVTTGLGGTVELISLERKMKSSGTNLIDVTSENNWYSQCFDSMTSSYEMNDTTVEFTIDATYNYGKTYTESDNTITFLSNQCYVYDFSDYVGETVTISFSAIKTEANAKVYLQIGKDIGENITEITDLSISEWTKYEQTVTVPEDGYIGFYLEKYQYTEELTPEEETEGIEATVVTEDYNLEVKDLQVELGSQATSYSEFDYDFLVDIRVNFIDENHVTYDESEDRCKYYIRITSSEEVKEYDYTYDSYENIEEQYQYQISESDGTVEYTIELIIKQYNREYTLSSVEFEYDAENCTEIKSISTVEEFKEIQPYGNYIILADIDLTDSSSKSEYTFGNPNISFYGSIDFNGKTISKDTYSLTRRAETTSYIFYKLEDTATIKNIVIDYNINNAKNRFTTEVDRTEQFIQPEDRNIFTIFIQ